MDCLFDFCHGALIAPQRGPGPRNNSPSAAKVPTQTTEGSRDPENDHDPSFPAFIRSAEVDNLYSSGQ